MKVSVAVVWDKAIMYPTNLYKGFIMKPEIEFAKYRRYPEIFYEISKEKMSSEYSVW